MSETLKNNGENLTPEEIEQLVEMGGKFDREKAEALAEQDRQKDAEEAGAEKETDESTNESLDEGEKELSPKDAADEYLSLLDELSKDFTYPYFKEGGDSEGRDHYAQNITTELGEKYSDDPHYHMRGRTGTEAGEDDRTMVRIACADSIIANEIGWREEGEKVGGEIERIDKDANDLEEEYSKKGGFGKFLGRRKFEKKKEEFRQARGAVEQKTGEYNRNIAKELAIAYNEEGDYDFNGGDYGESKNEERNRRFFGDDDSERREKVERAIELRKEYADKWAEEMKEK